MKKGEIKCKACGEIIKADEETWTAIDGRDLCEGCYNQAWEYPSSVMMFSPAGKDNNENTSFCADFGNGEDVMPIPIKSEKWVASDGWRGYTDWEYQAGYKEIADGWITGFPDESVSRKIELAEMFEDLKEGKVIPPCEIYWVFGRTSNLFSTASAIVIKEEDEEKLKAWLLEINGGIEGLKDMLS